jgi:DNA-binding transcriptional regulator GbsR (MarR family)
MGTRWGINRTVAQSTPCCTLGARAERRGDADTLSVARSNVGTSLKELQGWGLVKVTHVMGDRRDRTD